MLASQVNQVDDHTLTANKVDNLDPGDYDLRVVNPVGQEALTSNGLLIGRQECFRPLMVVKRQVLFGRSWPPKQHLCDSSPLTIIEE